MSLTPNKPQAVAAAAVTKEKTEPTASEAGQFVRIAQVVHEAVAAFNRSKGIYGDPRWEDCPLERRDRLIHTVLDIVHGASMEGTVQNKLASAIIKVLAEKG